jgi:hypothetical protein
VVAAGLCCLGGSAVAVAATPAGGSVALFVQPGDGQGNGKVLMTGAIGDFGETHAVHQGNKTYARATLREGIVEFDLTAVAAKAASGAPTFNAETCSSSFTVTAAAPIIEGTGHYKGISGSFTITESFGFIGSRYTSGAKKGQCNTSASSQPAAEMGTVYGSGTVSF